MLKQVPTDKNGSYSEESFLDILRTINIDTILIAHQKILFQVIAKEKMMQIH